MNYGKFWLVYLFYFGLQELNQSPLIIVSKGIITEPPLYSPGYQNFEVHKGYVDGNEKAYFRVQSMVFYHFLI